MNILSKKFQKLFILWFAIFSYPIFLYPQAPNFLWVKQMEGDTTDVSLSIKVDAAGNVYTTGYFEHTADFDPGPGTFTITSNGSTDIFVSKLDASGNFLWAKQIGGSSYDAGESLALDNAGNIYITGYFYSTVDFDPGISIYNLSPFGGSGGDIFVLKLNPSGNFVWAKQMGGSSDDGGYSIISDGLGNIYTTGVFMATANFDNGVSNFSLTSFGGEDIFISKLDASGNFVWAKQMGGLVLDVGYSIAVDASFNVYTTGSFRGTADFDPSGATYTLSTGGNIDNTFISKLDPSGNFVWAKQITGGSNGSASIVVDNSGNVYTIDNFLGTIDSDPSSAIHNLTSAGNGDILILKLDALGNFSWAKQIGGSSDDSGRSLVLDPSNNIYITGSFAGIVDFDPNAGAYTLPSSGNSDIFVLILNLSGNFVWAKQMGGSSYDYGSAITLDASGNIYTTGAFQAISNFDNGASNFTLTSAGVYDCFVNKMSPNFLAIKAFYADSSIYIYPNPTNNYLSIHSEEYQFKNSEIEITNILGQMVLKLKYADEIDVSSLSQGYYQLKITSPDKKIYHTKFIKE